MKHQWKIERDFEADLSDLFATNASIVRDLAKAAAEHCPNANILVISNPVSTSFAIVTVEIAV